MLPSIPDNPLSQSDDQPSSQAVTNPLLTAVFCPQPADNPSETATLPPRSAGGEAVTREPPAVTAAGERAAVPGYEVLSTLGRGGMGVVYQARHTKLGRIVALKMILSGAHAGEADLARFRTEGEAIARLQHPNIVQIYEVGELGGLPFFSLEFCGGGSLERKLNGTPLPAKEAAQLVETLARAIQAAHEKGVIHRDLKPANVLLAEDGTPKITDFGLAKKLDDAGQTQSGAIMGTPSYMAPEQAAGKSAEIGPAADVYALGAILYECLTGRPPFKAATALDTVLQVVSDEPVPPSQLQTKLPRDLETICLKCLQKEPHKRYASAGALANDLLRLRNGEPITARPVGAIERAAKWVRRRPTATALLAVSAVAALGFVLLLDRARREADSRSVTETDLRGQAETQRDQADAAREQSQDTLARSLYEQAHALRLSRQPGWRWQALDLLREAEKLRARPHRKDRSPLAEAEKSGPSSRLPTQADLRREAATALLLEDARPAPPTTLAASVGMSYGVSDDGRVALAGFMRLPEKIEAGSEIPMGVRLFDLSNRQQLGELLIPYTLMSRRMALSPDGTFLAQTEPGRQDVQLRDLPGGTPRATLPLLIGPAPAVAALNYDALVFSPDARYLAAPRGDGTKTDIFLWDVREPRASRHLARVDAPVGSLSFRGDGRVLAFPVGGNKIALADVIAGGEPKVIELPLPLAPSSAWNANGRNAGQRRLAWGAGSSLLAAACVNAAGKAAIVFWDTDRQAEQGRWDSDFDVATLRMAFSPNGKRLVAGDKEGTIRIYDIVAGAEALRLETHHPGGVGLLRWPTDDHLLTADLGGNSFTTWGLSGVSLSTILASGKARAIDLAYRPESRSLAVLRGGTQPEIVVIECDSGQLRPKIAVRADLKPSHLLFRPDGQQLALLGVSQAEVWDLPDWREKTYSLAARAGWQRGFPDTAFLSDGRLLVVDQLEKDWQIRLSVRDVVSGQEVGPGVTITLDRNDQPTLLGTAGMKARLSNDGRWLLGFPGSLLPSRVPITIWDVASGNRLGELSSTDVEQSSLILGTSNLSPDSKWLCHFHFPSNDFLSMDFSQARLRVWDVSNRQHHWDMRFAGSPSSMVFSPDSRLLAVAYEEGFVEVWDVQRREQFFRWQPLRAGKIGSLTFTSDAAFLACSGEKQGAVHLLRLGELRRHLAEMGLDW